MNERVMRIVAHIDMDAFFAAVEERDTPRFRGLPIAVGADPDGGRGRGVVAAANYKARAYGIHSALPITQAWRLSEAARRAGKPPVVFLSVDMKKYAAVSDRVMAIIRSHAPVVEEAGIDEAYADLGFADSYEKAEEVCRAIKDAIRANERLTASVGLGPNKMIAKIASNEHKPDGLTVVREEEAATFLDPLPVRKMPGIGPKTEAELAKQGIALVRDLKRFSREELQDRFGKRGLDFYEEVRGRDDAPLQEHYEPKSIGEEETFDRDTRDAMLIGERLKALCQEVMRRFERDGFETFRTVVVKVRFADFETHSRAHTLRNAANSGAALEREALKLLLPFLDRRDNPQHKAIRLIGVRVEKLG
ncbi:MAG: DNA polymerase IV [Nitrospirae bacterium]|nr:MAG: DNA polymerase IV [Nitrospirota bacterium]